MERQPRQGNATQSRQFNDLVLDEGVLDLIRPIDEEEVKLFSEEYGKLLEILEIEY